MLKFNISLTKFLLLFFWLSANQAFATSHTISSDQTTNYTLNSGDTLNFEGGTLNGAIYANTAKSGEVNVIEDTTLFGNIGTSIYSLGSVNISDNKTLEVKNNNIYANSIVVGNNATISYGDSTGNVGTILGEVDGSSDGVGTFIFNRTKTINFNIGESKKLENIDIENSVTLTLGSSVTNMTKISATNINIGSGSSGQLKSNGKNIVANNINIGSGATFNIASDSSISGLINGTSDGSGIVQFSGSSATISPSYSLGLTNKLAQILISNETSLNVNENIIFNASDVTIGEGSPSISEAPTINQNSGIIGADESSVIRLNSNAVFNYNGGTINGTIRGTSSNKGTFNINSDYTNNFEIGKSYDLANLNIAQETILTANANISANNISLAGTLDLSSSSKTITGNLSTSGGGASVNLGSFEHQISGNFTTSSGDTLEITTLDSDNVGALNVAGVANIAEGLNLAITLNTDNGYISDNSSFNLVAGGSGSTINSTTDNKININQTGSNQYGLLTFHTSKSGDNLVLTVDRQGAESFSDNQSVAKVYNNIDKVGSSAMGELRNLQKLIDSPTTSNIQRENLLKSIIPQSNQDLNNSLVSTANLATNISQNRLENIFFGSSSFNSSFNSFNGEKMLRNVNHLYGKEKIVNLSQLNFGDEQVFDSIFDEQIFDNQAFWIEGFGTEGKQKTINNVDGYNLSNQGLAVGVDEEVAKNLRLGISSSFARSNVKSQSVNIKQTNIDSYQFNLYGGYNFSPYFITALLGVAVNKYDSTRIMSDLNLIAKANYGGQTYITKLESGIIKKYFDATFISKISVNGLQNQIATYLESGAGTLNLAVSNQHNDFLEGRVGTEIRYDNLKISNFDIRPKLNLSYGYDFLAKKQSTTNNFKGQAYNFEISNSNLQKNSLKYGLGIDFYKSKSFLLSTNYDLENKSSYKSRTISLYLRYNFQ